MMMIIFKLWHDHKHQIIKIFYDKYDNNQDRLANTLLGVPPTNWKSSMKSRRNTDFEASTSHFVMVVHIIVMFM